MTSIQIPDDEARTSHTIGSTPSTGPFPIDYPFFSTSHIVVAKRTSDTIEYLTEGVDYTVNATSVTDDLVGPDETDADDGYSDGEVVLLGAESNCTIVTYRDTDILRMTDFPTAGFFNVAALNLELDRQVAIVQELQAEVNRAVRVDMIGGTLPAISYGSSGVIIYDGDSITLIDVEDLSVEVNYGGESYGGVVTNADYYGGTHYDTENDVANYYGATAYGSAVYGGTVVESYGTDYGGGVYGGTVTLADGVYYGGTFEEPDIYGGTPVFYGTDTFITDSYGGTINIVEVPAGGTTGQVLIKASDDDYDVTWGPGGEETNNTIGNGTDTLFTVAHAFGTDDVFIAVRETAGDKAIVYPDIKVADEDNVVIEFASPPTAGQYSYLIRGEAQ